MGVTDLLGAASLLLSEPALQALTARAGEQSKAAKPAGARTSEEAKA